MKNSGRLSIRTVLTLTTSTVQPTSHVPIAVRERCPAQDATWNIEAGTFYAGDPGRLARTLAAMQQVRLFDWVADGMREDPEVVIAELELSLRRAFCRRPRDRKDDAARGR